MPRKNPLEKLRKLCLALPESAEKETWEIPTFRVRDKIFAMFTEDTRGDGRVSVWCKALPGVQETLVGADPKRFYKPPYVGPNGWIGIHLNGEVDWEEVAGFIEDAYRMTAPKKLQTRMDQHPDGTATAAVAAKAKRRGAPRRR